tara:strand:+ start:922 stop:1371 length:450 start_codon:yes stop_codon:yes gene_type:complete
MQYIKQSDLRDWRNANSTNKCPISRADMEDCVVDHSHATGKIRGVLHRQSNVLLGKIENAWKRYVQKSSAIELPQVLRNMADYLEKEDLDLLHPYGATQLSKKFSVKKMQIQEKILLDLGFKKSDIKDLNSKERTKLFRKKITENKYES